MTLVINDCPAEKLFIEHNSWLRCWLLSRLECSYQAEDLVQDTFVRVIRRREQLRHAPLYEPKAYLVTIARGLLTDHWRRKELEQAWKETLAHLPEEAVPSPEIRLALFEVLTEIDEILDTLKPSVRRAFIWSQLEGYSCRRIAEELDVSLSTAERYVAKALRRCYDLRFCL
ncbi:sigma-70 family RNA polymerase sigma factor [Motiliproteus sp. MSK22-1]|uniref:sigma-70 family RNA polymerase sigma factor n=1 Tax=Motiliproteus sp. MSK22-1 TaxID=1897630 RepID=UPI0009769389|nr:sigma-70 family RNA polymerase sigma factor [Motiliproteus sp. MSK22-1]OMH25987.1 RNA polymerase subunit sigma [Motiliproteus sp. MSK22-1]